METWRYSCNNESLNDRLTLERIYMMYVEREMNINNYYVHRLTIYDLEKNVILTRIFANFMEVKNFLNSYFILIGETEKEEPKEEAESKNRIGILGTDYKIKFKTKEQEPLLEGTLGFCDNARKEIIVKAIADGSEADYFILQEAQRSIIKHELIHAFLYESGLNISSNEEWAVNEEMVDWIALQLPKLSKANAEADAAINNVKPQEEIK